VQSPAFTAAGRTAFLDQNSAQHVHGLIEPTADTMPQQAHEDGAT
jgi:hypothetical protein